MESPEKFKEEITGLLALDETELYQLLADDVVPPAMGLVSPKKRIEQARAWFEEQKSLIRLRICGSQALHYNLYDTERYETVMTVATIVDLIAGLLGTVPLNVVAVLIVKQGYKAYCKDFIAQ